MMKPVDVESEMTSFELHSSGGTTTITSCLSFNPIVSRSFFLKLLLHIFVFCLLDIYYINANLKKIKLAF